MRNTINTVNGEVGIDTLNYIMPHEHTLWLSEMPPPEKYASVCDEAYENLLPIYKELVEKHNCNTVVDVSTGYFIDIEQMRRLSKGSGMNIVLSTGWYVDNYTHAKREECYRPPFFRDNTAEVIAQAMIDELTVGMKGKDVKAGIIKVGMANLDHESDRKLLKAAAIAQKETGASITTHTCKQSERQGTLDFLEGAGVDPGRLYLGHADCTNGFLDAGICESLRLVKRGCNLLFTLWGITNASLIGWSNTPLPKHLSAYITTALVSEGYADNILLSIDYRLHYTNKKINCELYEIPERTPLYAFTYVVPQLKKLGVSQKDINKIMNSNPKRMLLNS